MSKKQTGNPSIFRLILQIFQGALIGLGAVLPGISGGVLCVVFGIYKPIMELLSNPFKNFKTHVPRLIPVIIGAAIGEWLGADAGLGYFSRRMMTQLDGAGVFAPIVLLSVVAMVAVALVSWLEKKVITWRGDL